MLLLTATEVQEVTGVQIGNWIIPIVVVIVGGLLAWYLNRPDSKITREKSIVDSMHTLIETGNELNARTEKLLLQSETAHEKTKLQLVQSEHNLAAAQHMLSIAEERLTNLAILCDNQQAQLDTQAIELHDLHNQVAALTALPPAITTTTTTSSVTTVTAEADDSET